MMKFELIKTISECINCYEPLTLGIHGGRDVIAGSLFVVGFFP